MKKTLIFITGLGFGAALAYLFEPVKGDRQGMSTQNKMARQACDEGNVIDCSLPGAGRDRLRIEAEPASIINGTHATKTETVAGNFAQSKLSYLLNEPHHLHASVPAIPCRAEGMSILRGSFFSKGVWCLQKAKSIYERTSRWPLLRELYMEVARGGRLLFGLIGRVSFGMCLCAAGLGILTRRFGADPTVPGTKGWKDNRFTKKETILVAGFVSLALLSRLSLMRFHQVMTPDGVYYATLGKNLVSGHFSEGLSTFWPPLYPMLTGLASLVFRDAEIAGKMVSALAGGLLVLPVYLLMRILYGTGAALAGAFLIAVHPALNYYSTLLLTESTYTLLFMTALLLGLAALFTGGVAFFSTGVVLGACYLIRPEAIGYLGLMLALALGVGFRGERLPPRRVLLNALSLITGFTLTASPYILFLRQRTGRWTISDKLRALVDSSESLERKWFGLAAGRRTTLADRLYAGIYQEEDRAIEAAPFIASPRDLLRAIGHSIEALKWETSFLIHHMIPPHFMVLMGLGLFKANWWMEIYLLLFFAATLIGYAMLPDAVEGRLLLPLLPLVLCWVARGVEEVVVRFDSLLNRLKFSRAFSLKAGDALRAAAMAALLLSLLPRIAQTFIRGQLDQPLEHKQAGAWIREHSGAGSALVMATNPYAAFYAGGKPVYLPAEEYLTVIEHARRQKVDYLVIDEGVVSRGHWGNDEYSNLRFLLDERCQHPELELVYKFDELPNRKILIFTLTRDAQPFNGESIS